MGRQRITVIVDNDARANNGYMSYTGPAADYFGSFHGITIESVEDLPEPRRQRFIVDVGVGPQDYATLLAAAIQNSLERHWMGAPVHFTVTEVEVES